jgi:hypothetical protein
MNPSIWKDNKLKTAGGQSYVTLDSVQPDQIVVANDYLILDGLSSNLFCVVGITSSSTDPALPPDFSTYSAFVNWIHQNQNICVRNLCLCRSFPDRQYERLDFFENPEDHDVLVAIKVSATDNLPSGTTFGVQCDPMGINKSQTVDQGRILTASGMCPEGFQGNVLTYGSLPSGSTWPSGGGLLTEIYVGREENDIAAQYAVDWDSFPIKPHELTGLSSNGILIRVGDCSTEFIS